MLTRIVLLTFFVLMALGQAVEAALDKNDFAYGFRLQVEGDDALYSLPLPSDVYTKSVAANLKDVRVFNNAGEVVRHEFRYAAPVTRPVTRTVEIPYSPLSLEKEAADEDNSLEIKKNINGKIVSIERKGSSIQLPASSYILDMTEAGSYPLTLRLEWKNNGTGFILPVEIAGSPDLAEWNPIKKVTLANLEFMGRKLSHREIVLQDNPGKYLRLIFGPRGNALQLTGVKAVSGEELEQAKRSWLNLPLQEVETGNTTIFQAKSAGTLPVDRMQVQFPQSNMLLHARISTKSTKEPWQLRTEALFYELLENGIVLQNDPVKIPRQNINYVRLESLTDSTTEPGNAFQLQVGFIPHKLVFLAQGNGPFVLAYGNANIKADEAKERSPDVHGLAGEKKLSIVPEAGVGEKIILGGEDRLAKKAAAPWQTILLWLIVFLCFGIIALLAWSAFARRQ